MPISLVEKIVSMIDNFFMDKLFLEKVASRIKLLRKKKGLSQDDLACDAEVSRSTISMLEIVRTDITLSKIKKIAEALGVEPYELLKFD